jgi:hypothetical protein
MLHKKMKKKAKKFQIKSFAKNFLLILKFRGNSIGAEGAKELAQDLKTLINLK